MSEFLQALTDPHMAFLRYAMITGLLASVAFGMMGSLVVVRRISYIAAAIAHCVLAGIGGALYLRAQYGVEWLTPMHGAIVAALTSAIVIGLVSIYAEEREDTVIGALWSTGMAVGLLFLARTPGYVDPMSYIWGDILMITRQDIWLVIGLDVVIVAGGALFYHKLLAVCFDEEFTRLRGIHTHLYFLAILCLTALTVVLLVNVVGIVLVIAMLTLPAAVAGQFARHLWQMMLLATGLCMLFTAGGLGLSYHLNWPSGPTIIVIAGGVFIANGMVGWLWRRLRARRTADAR